MEFSCISIHVNLLFQSLFGHLRDPRVVYIPYKKTIKAKIYTSIPNVFALLALLIEVEFVLSFPFLVTFIGFAIVTNDKLQYSVFSVFANNILVFTN